MWGHTIDCGLPGGFRYHSLQRLPGRNRTVAGPQRFGSNRTGHRQLEVLTSYSQSRKIMSAPSPCGASADQSIAASFRVPGVVSATPFDIRLACSEATVLGVRVVRLPCDDFGFLRSALSQSFCAGLCGRLRGQMAKQRRRKFVPSEGVSDRSPWESHLDASLCSYVSA
jgi:hypothetical protein